MLKEICEISHTPLVRWNCGGKKRRTSCYCCFRPIFGSTRQMGYILAKTFEGFKLKIPVAEDPKIKLDCMFFTATCEPMEKNETKD